MNAKHPSADPERGITRRDLEAVIRRAAELYAAQADADERISEEELLRIASELGLPARYVRQALLEVPAEPETPSWVDRFFGPEVVGGTRTVPHGADRALARLDEYLTTREFLRLRRRQQGRAWYVPADDAISRVARAFSRPAARFHVARAQEVVVATQPLEPDWAHVRIEVDLSGRRKQAVTNSVVGGGILGVGGGIALAAVVGVAAGPALGDIGAVAAAAASFAATAGGAAAGILAIGRAAYRGRRLAARAELEGLLDRLESGQSLEPPPAPWRRRLQSRFAGLLGPVR